MSSLPLRFALVSTTQNQPRLTILCLVAVRGHGRLLTPTCKPNETLTLVKECVGTKRIRSKKCVRHKPVLLMMVMPPNVLEAADPLLVTMGPQQSPAAASYANPATTNANAIGKNGDLLAQNLSNAVTSTSNGFTPPGATPAGTGTGTAGIPGFITKQQPAQTGGGIGDFFGQPRQSRTHWHLAVDRPRLYSWWLATGGKN